MDLALPFVDPEPGHVPILIKGLAPFVDGHGVVSAKAASPNTQASSGLQAKHGARAVP